MSKTRDERLLEATRVLAGIAMVGNPDYFLDDDDSIAGDRLTQLFSLSAQACGFLVRNQDLLRQVLSEEEFETVSQQLDLEGLEDEMAFGSARFADKEDA